MYEDYRIKRITVNSFRGISYESSIDFGNITILCGENGTGKSSFVNAFEYLFSKELDFLKRDTIEKEESIIHNGNTKEDIGINVCFENGKTLEYGKKPKDPEIKEIINNDYVKSASFILNRRNLLKFVEGNRSDRYNAVMDLCGFNKLKRYQSTFSSTFKDINKEFENKLNEYDDRLGKLSQIIVKNYDAKYEESIFELNKIIERNGLDLIDDDTNISEYLVKLHIDSDDYLSRAKREFDLIFDEINKDDLDLELKDLLSEYDNVVYDNFKSTNELIALLDKSYDYIETNTPEKCPVCDSDMDENILGTINNKRNLLKEKDKQFSHWKHEFNKYLSKLNVFIRDLEDLDANILKLKSKDSNNELNISFNNERLILGNLYSDLNDLINTGEKINVNESLFREIHEKVTLFKEKLYKYFEENNDNSDLFIINNALVELSKIKDLEVQISNLDSRRLVAKKALDTFTKSKEEFINGIINDIKDDIKIFYNHIHKGDAITSPDIRLTGANHLEVFLDSFGKSVDPRSFASEGHLDSLGLCIFLAFNKKFNPIPLIILDDVVATVDMGHKEKIARLLIEELDDYQIFITTHSKLWAEQLRRLANIKQGRQPKNYEIISWNKKEGPILAIPIDSEEKIDKYLNPDHYDLNAAGNTARRYLEYILKQICRANKLEIPYEDKPQCEDFYNKASSHINKTAKTTSFEGYYKDLWEELRKTKFMANILSHDNIDFDEISYNEVRDFCNAVINLRKEVTCKYHQNNYIVFDKSRKSMTCSKDDCKFIIDMNTFKFENDENENNK